MGLFTPKWETNNIKKKDKAIAAVSAVKDEETLYEISRTAPLEDVRVAAAVRIKDSRIRRRILENCTDQKVLCELLKEIEPIRPVNTFVDSDLVRQAIMKIDDQQMLAELAQMGFEPAVFRLEDKEALFKLISDMTWFRSIHHGFILPQDHKAHLALYASKKFTEKDEVLRAAKAVCYEGAAAEKVEEIIKNGWMSPEEIALDESFSRHARVAAIKMTTNQDVLQELATHDDEHLLVIREAKKRIELLQSKRG